MIGDRAIVVLAFALCVVLFAGTVSGLAGFGFALLTAPPLLLVYEPPTVVMLGLSLTLISGWFVVIEYRAEIQRPTVIGLVPAAAVGMVLGIMVLEFVEASVIRLIAGIVVVAFTIILVRGWMPSNTTSPAAVGMAGLMSGILTTTTGMSGPPIILLLAARKLGIHQFRATTVAYFILIDIIGLSLLYSRGVIGMEELKLVAILLPAGLAGTFLGRWAATRITTDRFRRVVHGLLVLSGAVAIVTTVATYLPR